MSSSYEDILAGARGLEQCEQDLLVQTLLDEGGVCRLQGHNYTKIGTTPQTDNWWKGKQPAQVHLICKRCGNRKDETLPIRK